MNIPKTSLVMIPGGVVQNSGKPIEGEFYTLHEFVEGVPFARLDPKDKKRIDSEYRDFFDFLGSDTTEAASTAQTTSASDLFDETSLKNLILLDLLVLNTDRHADNILFQKDPETGKYKLIPIDHGLCFPQKFNAYPLIFVWENWIGGLKVGDLYDKLESWDQEAYEHKMLALTPGLSDDLKKTTGFQVLAMKKAIDQLAQRVGCEPRDVELKELVVLMRKICDISREEAKRFPKGESVAPLMGSLDAIVTRSLNALEQEEKQKDEEIEA